MKYAGLMPWSRKTRTVVRWPSRRERPTRFAALALWRRHRSPRRCLGSFLRARRSGEVSHLLRASGRAGEAVEVDVAVVEVEAVVAREDPQHPGEVEAVEQPAALGAQEGGDRVPGKSLEAGVGAQTLAVGGTEIRVGFKVGLVAVLHGNSPRSAMVRHILGAFIELARSIIIGDVSVKLQDRMFERAPIDSAGGRGHHGGAGGGAQLESLDGASLGPDRRFAGACGRLSGPTRATDSVATACDRAGAVGPRAARGRADLR